MHLELEISILESKNADLKEQLDNASNNIGADDLNNRLDSIEWRLDKLESNKK